MKTIFKKIRMIGVGLMLTLHISLPAVADDIEIYTTVDLGATTIKPNVMFILDSSASMLATNTPAAVYDHGVTYPGDTADGCVFDANHVYYSFDSSIPACGTADHFNLSALMCDNAVKKYIINNQGDFVVSQTAAGVDDIGSLIRYGHYSDKFAQFSGSSRYRWLDIKTTNAAGRALLVECKQDSGVHGSVPGVYYIADTSAGWEGAPITGDPNNPHGVWSTSATSGTIYHGNYMNYLVEPNPAVADPISLFNQVKEVIISTVAGQTEINIGLMQYDTGTSAEGGSVQYPITDVQASRGDFEPRVLTMNAGGSSTISETYYEALKYFGGREVDFGNTANPSNNGDATELSVGTQFYTTPITDLCQKNYIIVLSDGAPDKDYVNVTRQDTMDGFPVGECNLAADDALDWNKNPDDSTATDDNCLDELSYWAKNEDVATQSIDAHDGMQNITTYTVGFKIPVIEDPANPLSRAKTLLEKTAANGGGIYYEADNAAELAAKIKEILSGILTTNATFSSPAVSVNAFNRATNLDDLFFTLFRPTEKPDGASGEHWEGNLKKFKLEFSSDSHPVNPNTGELYFTDAGTPYVADQNSNPAVNEGTGFFEDHSLSYWTVSGDLPANANGADGSETALGGAASRIVIPRNTYTFTGTYSGTSGLLTPSTSDITTAANALEWTNTSITDTLLGNVAWKPNVLATWGDFTFTFSYTDGLLLWAYGYDIHDDANTTNSFATRRVMGDPLHAEPALVQYGLVGTAPNTEPDLVAYVATNDGYLHAFNTLTGDEYFAFVPQEMLPKLQNIFEDTGVNGKAYGLDGNVVPWINDVNGDGEISGTDEHIYLYFGMRRGGHYIYSMDVTDRNEPKLRWVIKGGGIGEDYEELGQTWSPPNVEKIKMGDDDKVVLIFGAGYDEAHDVETATRDSTTGDTVGRGIYIVDAETGVLLWRAGADGDADLQLVDMKYSIPARIKPLDVDGDGYIDRLYAGDLGGQLWRIDINNSASTSTDISATGGRIADFAVDGSLADNRRFYFPPDAAIITEEGKAPYVSVVAASGYRAHPLQTDTHDRIYMIRDYDVYNAPAGGSYTTVTEANLFDTTDNLIGQGTVDQINTATVTLTGATGWYIDLNEMDGTFVGEKALAEPLILDGVAIITTYIPASAGLTTSSCTANDGTGAIYYIHVTDGTPTTDETGDSTKTREDRRVFLARGGIPPTPRVIITEEGIPTLCVGTECTTAGEVGTIEKIYWYELE